MHMLLLMKKIMLFLQFMMDMEEKKHPYIVLKIYTKYSSKASYLKKKQLKRALEAAFITTDSRFCAAAEKDKTTDGTTAVSCLIAAVDVKTPEDDKPKKERVMVFANAGDSRVVLSRKGKAKQITTDHKPSSDKERERIERYGGIVLRGSVNGVLGCSRSIGDYELKDKQPIEENIITSKPDVWKFVISPDMEFFIMACDGVWDVLANDTAVDVVRKVLLETKLDADKAAEALVRSAFNNKSMDNLSALVVVLNEFK